MGPGSSVPVTGCSHIPYLAKKETQKGGMEIAALIGLHASLESGGMATLLAFLKLEFCQNYIC